MQIDGILCKWNDDRGFGFISPALGGQEIFVHISAFPKNGRRPQIGEPLSFEIDTDKDGRKRALGVERPARATVVPAQRRETARARPKRGLFGRILPLLVLIVLGTAVYGEHSRRSRMQTAESDVATARHSGATASQTAEPMFHCDGRTHCSQMSSCAEATFFLRNCPGVTMDGDNDGVPCEQQWCGR